MTERVVTFGLQLNRQPYFSSLSLYSYIIIMLHIKTFFKEFVQLYLKLSSPTLYSNSCSTLDVGSIIQLAISTSHTTRYCIPKG